MAEDFKITEGLATVLRSSSMRKSRWESYSTSKQDPSYPAIFWYEPATDEPLWVECHDPFTIHIARIKNTEALNISEEVPRQKSLFETARSWGADLHKHLRDRGILCRLTESPPDGACVESVISVAGILRSLNKQLHLEWDGQSDNMSMMLEILAKKVARSLGSSRDLYSCILRLPSGGVEAVGMRHGHLRARAVRRIVCRHDNEGDIIDVSAITRIDILFPVF